MLAAPISAASAQAQTVTIGLQVRDCKGAAVPNATVSLNGQAFQTNANGASFGGPVTAGRVQVRAVAPGEQHLVLSYVTFAPSGVSGSATSYADLEGNAAFDTGRYSGELLVTMCPGKGGVHVKIVTTASCTDAAGAGFTVQPGVTVRIGAHSYTSNANGVIDAVVPAGDYEVSAAWKDYALGYVAQNSLRQAKSETGATRIRLSVTGEILEVRMLTCEPNGQAKARAVITSMPGNPIVVRRSRASGKGFVGMQLRDGDVVTVYQGTLKWLADGATISFASGPTTIVIGPNQKPAGSRSAPAYDPGRIELLKGVIEFFGPAEQAEPTDENGRVLFSTHGVVLRIKGTEFALSYDPKTQTTAIDLRRGTVSVTPQNAALRPFTLAAGQKVSVSMNRIGTISGTANVPRVAAPAVTQPSAHGCVGFNGTWQGPLGTMRLRNGSGAYSTSSGEITIRGTSVAPGSLSGTYAFSTGGGSFVFTLAPNGDSFGTIFTSSAGVRGDYTVMQCAGA